MDYLPDASRKITCDTTTTLMEAFHKYLDDQKWDEDTKFALKGYVFSAFMTGASFALTFHPSRGEV